MRGVSLFALGFFMVAFWIEWPHLPVAGYILLRRWGRGEICGERTEAVQRQSADRTRVRVPLSVQTPARPNGRVPTRLMPVICFLSAGLGLAGVLLLKYYDSK